MPINDPEIVLNECRELMTNRLCFSLSRMMGNLEDVLFDMASRDECQTDNAFYIDAIRELRLKKREIQVRFDNRLCAYYMDMVRQLLAAQNYNIASDTGPDEPALSMEKTINDINILSEPVEQTRQGCRQALLILDRNISRMIDDIDADEIVNPMKPEIIYNAFWDSCDDLYCGTEIRLLMLQMFQFQVAVDLENIYGDLNVLLDYSLQENNFKPLGRDTVGACNELTKYQLKQNIDHEPQIVKSWVQFQIHEQIAGQKLPDMIETFLFEHWSELLADIFCHYSMESLEWERAVQVIDDLVECATLRHDKQSKLQQIWQFPGLVYRLKAGMKTISLPLSLQARFISDLKVFHSQLVGQNLNIKNN
ncbi:MAG: DUF1631 family protein [Gammaproteobacteria bacterium]|nr:DUF1631 family protein [Gammaproteobacteria bacterium]